MIKQTRTIKKWVWFLFLAASSAFSQSLPKYIFLFIGDGMGEPHVLAAEQYSKDLQLQNGVREREVQGLQMTSLPVQGRVSTASLSSAVTDSAASATAFSTGKKVPNASVNIDAEGNRLEPMAGFAKRYGLKVGIISSAAPNHATPAGFYAIAEKRHGFPDIALQMVNSDLDYIGGPFLMRAERSDAELIEMAVKNGFTVAGTRQEFDALRAGGGKVWAYSEMGMIIDKPHVITLADHTRKAIELLKESGGFFMMVEGALIDWAGHANDGASMIYEMMDFDEAVGAAIAFYRQNPEDTLILVTSDHETGGLSLDLDKLNAPDMSSILRAQKGSRNRSAPAFRVMEREKMGFEQALPRMKDYFGVTNLTESELQEIRTVFSGGGEAKGDFSYGDSRTITLAWSRLVSARAGLNWSSLSHTADPVPLYAVGAQAERFKGDTDNAQIGRMIRELIEPSGETLSSFLIRRLRGTE